jgi:putative transposase
MEITRGYKTELNLNNKQRTLCLQHAGCARYAYNWGLARKQAAYAARKAATDPKSVKIPTAIDLHKELNALKSTEFPWMYASSKCAPQEALRNLDTAFSNFFAKRAKYSKFKKRSKGIGSFTLTGHIHVGSDWIQLPNIGKVRLFEHGYLPQDTDLDTTDRKTRKKRDKKKRIGIGVTAPAHYLRATISERAGHWFVSVQVTQIVPDPEGAIGDPIGVDLGIKTLAVCSGGQEIPNPKALRSNLGKLQRTQRHHSKKQKGSNNRKQSKQQVARLHYRIACLREDALHQATALITAKAKPASERPQAIILEDLNVSGMLKNHKLAQAIADVGLGEFRRQMTYKSRWYGNALYLAHPFFPSTQLCSQCHRLPSVPLDLSIRTYHCEHCGLVLDRDLNAARNLVWLYTASSAEIHACGEIVSPKVLALWAVSAKQEPNTE